MRAELSRERLRRLRLAAQCLLPGHEARSPREAARAVVGVQAQDVRAAALALRAFSEASMEFAMSEIGT